MWRRISLLFIVVCFMKEDIFCDEHVGSRGPTIPDMDSSHEIPPIPGMDSSHERPPFPGMDSSHERPPIPCMDSSPSIPDNLEGGDNNQKDNAHPERHRVGTILLVVLPVVGVLVLIILVICGICILKKRGICILKKRGICILKKRGICILKKRNHEEIKTKNYQDMGITEKHQIAFTSSAIYPDNPPPYTPTMEYVEIKSIPKECPGFSAGWYEPVMANMPPSSTKIVDQALQIEPQY